MMAAESGRGVERTGAAGGAGAARGGFSSHQDQLDSSLSLPLSQSQQGIPACSEVKGCDPEKAGTRELLEATGAPLHPKPPQTPPVWAWEHPQNSTGTPGQLRRIQQLQDKGHSQGVLKSFRVEKRSESTECNHPSTATATPAPPRPPQHCHGHHGPVPRCHIHTASNPCGDRDCTLPWAAGPHFLVLPVLPNSTFSRENPGDCLKTRARAGGIPWTPVGFPQEGGGRSEKHSTKTQ